MKEYCALLCIFISLAIKDSLGGDLEGYTVNDSIGKAYKIIYIAQNWTMAKEDCALEGAKLAVPKSKEEFTFLQQDVVRKMQYQKIVGSNFKLLAWLGISNLEDYRVWKNIDGENINDTGFHDWSGDNGQNPSSDPKEPHCVGMDAHNPGLRDYWCHLAQPFVCEKNIS